MRRTNINKLLFLFIATVSLLGTIPNAYAFDKNKEYKKLESNNAVGGNEIKWVTTGKYYYNARYSADIDGVNTNLYCLDPGVSDPKYLKYSRTIFDPESEEHKSGDYGLIQILNAKPEDYDFSDDGKWYNVQSIAVRLFADGYKNWALPIKNENHKQRLKALQNHAAKVRGVGTTAGLTTTGDTGVKILSAAEKLFMVGVHAAESYEEGKSIKVTVASAGEVVKNTEKQDETSYPITEHPAPEGYNPASEPTGIVTETKESLKIVEFDLENFNKEEGSFTIDSLDVTSGTGNFQAEIMGVSFQNTKNWDDYSTPISIGNNVFDQFTDQVIDNGDGKKSLRFYLAVKTTTTAQINIDDENSEEETCEKGTARLRYSYEDPETFSGAVLYGSHGGKAVRSEQRFVFISKGKQKIEEVYDKIEDTACATYNSCAPTICIGDECENDKTLPQVCEDDMEPDENNNVEYKFLEAYQNGRYTIKKCLLKGKKDAADNSYKLVDDANAPAVADNPYCSIMCKEDYIFTLPYKRYTEEGRYFDIQMALKGQQDCYSTSINYDQYNKDILDQTVLIMEAYNEWAKYYELVNGTLVKDTTKEINCRKTNCETEIDENSTDISCSEDGSSISETDYEYYIEFEKLSGIRYFVNGNNNVRNTTITLSDGTVYSANTTNLAKPEKRYFGNLGDDANHEGSCSEEASTCEVSGYTCDITTAQEDYDAQKNSFEASLSRAKDELDEEIERLKEIIDELNSCVGDHNYQAYSKRFQGSAFWDMVYKYAPEIKYSYDEPDPTDTTIPKWIDDVKNITCEDSTCDTMFAKDEEIKAEFCASGSTNCTSVGSTGKVESIFSSEENPIEVNVNTYCVGDIKDDYSCNGTEFNSLSDPNAYENKNQLICEFKNNIYVCSPKEFKQTKINYLHKVAVASGNYDTRRVYYTGHDDGDVIIDAPDLEKENYSIVKGLPVGANTPQGTYFYILAIDNIGTFYSTGELGRVYGTNPNSLSEYARSLASTNGEPYNNQVTITNDDTTEITKELATNEYACSYDVSQNSCTDNSGNYHTMDECDFGEDGQDKDWDACKKRICGVPNNGGGYCVKTAEGYYSCNSENYSEESCTQYPDRQSAIAASTENYNCCPNCTVVCVGKCLIVIENDEENDAKLQLDFRTITAANINPNNRQLGYNWDSKNGSNHLVAQKAGNTISEIEARANGQTNYPGALAVNDYALKVTMTPDMVTWIKKYNNEHLDDGNYNNKTLTCYDYTLSNLRDEDTCEKAGYIWQKDKCIMANIFCYSSFIDDLEESFSDNIDAPNRASAKGSALSNFQTYKQVSAGVNGSGNITTNDYWTIYEYTTLDINSDGIPDIGPSWK